MTVEKEQATKLSPERFTWEKYCGKLNYSVCHLTTDTYAYKNFRLQSNVTYVGWC